MGRWGIPGHYWQNRTAGIIPSIAKLRYGWICRVGGLDPSPAPPRRFTTSTSRAPGAGAPVGRQANDSSDLRLDSAPPPDGRTPPGAGVRDGDRKSVGSGKSVSCRVDPGGRRRMKKKKKQNTLRKENID